MDLEVEIVIVKYFPLCRSVLCTNIAHDRRSLLQTIKIIVAAVQLWSYVRVVLRVGLTNE